MSFKFAVGFALLAIFESGSAAARNEPVSLSAKPFEGYIKCEIRFKRSDNPNDNSIVLTSTYGKATKYFELQASIDDGTTLFLAPADNKKPLILSLRGLEEGQQKISEQNIDLSDLITGKGKARSFKADGKTQFYAFTSNILLNPSRGIDPKNPPRVFGRCVTMSEGEVLLEMAETIDLLKQRLDKVESASSR